MESFRCQFGEVELTDERETHIFQFHPDIRPYRKYFASALEKPEFIRRSKYDPLVLLLYKPVSKRKNLVIVIKTNKRNFVLTAYLTDKIPRKSL